MYKLDGRIPVIEYSTHSYFIFIGNCDNYLWHTFLIKTDFLATKNIGKIYLLPLYLLPLLRPDLEAARAPRRAIFLAARALATRRLVGMVAPPAPRRVRPVAMSNATAPAPATASPGQMG